MTDVAQAELFAERDAFPRGFAYAPEFITQSEEQALLAEFANLPFNEAHFQQYTARRRVVPFGEGDYPASYGAEGEEVNPRRPFPDFLRSLRGKVAACANATRRTSSTRWSPSTARLRRSAGTAMPRISIWSSAFRSQGRHGCAFGLTPRSPTGMRPWRSSSRPVPLTRWKATSAGAGSTISRRRPSFATRSRSELCAETHISEFPLGGRIER